VNYYPFHIGDYASATRHLSWDEDAAYRRLLDVYYTQEKPLPTDLRAVFRLVLASTEDQREAVRVVLEEFFEATPDGWINKRADGEIDAMRDKQQKQREKANKRWHKPEQEHGNAPAMPRHTEADAVASNNNANAMPPTPTPTPTPTPVLKTLPDKPAKRAPSKHAMPDDFVVSERVSAWAIAAGYSSDRVASNFAKFALWAKAKGATYADWDAALMNAIRDDWAARGASSKASGQQFQTKAERIAANNKAALDEWEFEMTGKPPVTDFIEGDFSHAGN